MYYIREAVGAEGDRAFVTTGWGKIQKAASIGDEDAATF